MDRQHRCETCGGFIPRTELLMPRCGNTGASPLAPHKIAKISRQGCPVWSSQVLNAE